MKVYLVGGAVRDQLLGKAVVERDWVVVGGEPDTLLKDGFMPVGKDFPVFLHPETHEEYALARTERKVAPGYAGFQFYADSSVTLEEDLRRRDLTINAIAQDKSGQLIDPFNGREDIQKRLLRHVSEAFVEDPVRVLRIARFAAKLPDFGVAPETQELLQQMVKGGEVDALVPERVWKECSRALTSVAPWRFFEVLADCGALPIILPGLMWNQEKQTLLQRAATISEIAEIRLAVLLHDLTAEDGLALCRLLKIPNVFSELALLIIKHYSTLLSVDINSAQGLLALLKKTDALRRPNRFAHWLIASNVIGGDKVLAVLDSCRQAQDAVACVSTQPLQDEGLSGQAFSQALDELRLQAIDQKIKK